MAGCLRLGFIESYAKPKVAPSGENDMRILATFVFDAKNVPPVHRRVLTGWQKTLMVVVVVAGSNGVDAG